MFKDCHSCDLRKSFALQGVTWLSYTYLHVRMRRNPLAYGVPLSDREGDPQLLERRRQLIAQAAETLDDHKVGGAVSSLVCRYGP